MRHRKNLILAIVVILLFGVYVALQRNSQSDNSSISNDDSNGQQLNDISVIASGLDTPWALVALPNGSIMTSERNGIIKLSGSDKQQFEIADVIERGEGGLLGLAIDPNFTQNNYIYIYKTTGNSNIVERYVFSNNQLSSRTDILTRIPSAVNHNGGAIAFGPDAKLYVTTGDAQQEDLAQDRMSLAGKILRINSDGSIPADNPFSNAIWSYGHRNPQGLAWDDQDRLWSTEHGPSGPQSGNDELNLITRGGNYGWPVIRGNQTRSNMISPVAESGTDDTWAPAGLTYAANNLYFTGLRGETLYKAAITGNTVSLSKHLTGDYGRLRAIFNQNSELIIGTSNKDSRGSPKDGDDKLLRVPLRTLE